jgi:nitrite reductase/ring-hydroxylating ferredoxin subunit
LYPGRYLSAARGEDDTMSTNGEPFEQQALERLAHVSEIPVGGGKVVKRRGKQIALVRIDEDRVFAIDNRCPHEGYPLVEGTVKDCVLTCDWHNWKFDLRSGACLRGGEDVRAYPLLIKEGEIHVDLRDPDPGAQKPRAEASFREAVLKRDMGRAARDALRLLELGSKPEDLIAEATEIAAARLEWGWDHGLTVAAECVRALPLYEGAERVIPVTQAVAGAMDRALNRPVRPRPPVEEGAGARSMEEARRSFRELLEAEEQERAEATFIRALEAGMGIEEAKRWLFTAATDHFLDYGHGIIYAVRAIQMLELVGWEWAPKLLPSVAFQIAWGTREDRLPYMRRFQALLREVEPELSRLFELQGQGEGPAGWSGEELFKQVVDGSLEDGVSGVLEALRAGVSFDRIISPITAAAGERLLRFDRQIDRDPTREEGWLDVTHLITHANAARTAFAMQPSPELLRALFYSARFVWSVRKLDRPGEAAGTLPDPEGIERPGEEILSAIEAAIGDRDERRALALTRGYLAAGHAEEALGRRLIRFAIADSASVEIMIAHTIKTTVAAVEELAAIREPYRALPLLGAVRFLAAPKRERWVYRNTLRALSMLT